MPTREDTCQYCPLLAGAARCGPLTAFHHVATGWCILKQMTAVMRSGRELLCLLRRRSRSLSSSLQSVIVLKSGAQVQINGRILTLCLLQRRTHKHKRDISGCQSVRSQKTLSSFVSLLAGSINPKFQPDVCLISSIFLGG